MNRLLEKSIVTVALVCFLAVLMFYSLERVWTIGSQSILNDPTEIMGSQMFIISKHEHEGILNMRYIVLERFNEDIRYVERVSTKDYLKYKVDDEVYVIYGNDSKIYDVFLTEEVYNKELKRFIDTGSYKLVNSK